MERLDKVIASQTEYSRKDVKKLVQSKRILVNGEVIKSSDIKIDKEKDVILIDGKNIDIQEHVYLVLNKPEGYISATEDRTQKTVLDLIDEKYVEICFLQED